MTGDLRLGILCSDTPRFFDDIARQLQERFRCTLFKERTGGLGSLSARLGNWRLRRDIAALMSVSDVCFFEWAAWYLAIGSHLDMPCKIVTRLHQFELFRWDNRVNWERLDRVIIVGSGMEKAFARRHPDQSGKTVVIPEGIRLDRFDPRPRPFSGRVGTLCNIEPRKRVYELILAFHALVTLGLDLRLVIGGGEDPRHGDYYQAILVLIEKLALGGRVVLDGPVVDTPRWFKNIDIFVSNSYSEGLQVAPIESMAAGCYCLSHGWDGAEDYLDPDALFLSEPEFVRLVSRYCALDDCAREALRRGQYDRIAALCDVSGVSGRIARVIEDVAGLPRSAC